MVDLNTATAEEVVSDAVRITQMVSKERSLSSGVLFELVEWLCAYTIRLHNDLMGIPSKSHEDVQKEIERWSEIVKQHSKD